MSRIHDVRSVSGPDLGAAAEAGTDRGEEGLHAGTDTGNRYNNQRTNQAGNKTVFDSAGTFFVLGEVNKFCFKLLNHELNLRVWDLGRTHKRYVLEQIVTL